MVEASIFWFRRDLRIDDNPGLYEALANSKNVIPIFIFDTNIIDNLPSDDNRIKFIWHSLSLLNERLKEVGSTLNIFKGNPLEVFKKIILKYRLISVYVNRDYEKYSIKRDKEINTFLNGNKIAFVQIAGLVARRIICDVDIGHSLMAGEVFGLIRFGCRVGFCASNCRY